LFSGCHFTEALRGYIRGVKELFSRFHRFTRPRPYINGQSPARAGVKPHLVAPPPPGTFTIAVVPDTQDYTPDQPHLFEAATRWIARHAAAQKIAFVTHVGDVVGFPNAHQYDMALRCLAPLHGRVPYGLCPGNRDIIPPNSDTTDYCNAFGPHRFDAFPWYAEYAFSGVCSAQLLTACRTKLLFVHLPCNAPDAMLDWANRVLSRHPKRMAFVTTHAYLGPVHRLFDKSDWQNHPRGVMQWHKCFGKSGNAPSEMWDKCFSKHPQLRMIFCGDQSRIQTYHLTQPRLDMSPVHSLMSDYRAGAIRLVRVTPTTGQVQVITFSPALRKLIHTTENAPSAAMHQFAFQLDGHISSAVAV